MPRASLPTHQVHSREIGSRHQDPVPFDPPTAAEHLPANHPRLGTRHALRATAKQPVRARWAATAVTKAIRA